MKKIILLLGSVVLLANFALAQNDEKFGMTGGTNFSIVKDVNQNNEKSLAMGYQIGAYGTFMRTRRMAIQPEVLLSFQNFKTKKENDKVNYNNIYLNIPVKFKHYLSRDLDFNIFAGPQLGVLLNAKNTFVSNKEMIYNNMKNNYNTLNLSAVFGIGYDSHSVNFSLCYSTDLTSSGQKISDTENVDIANEDIIFKNGGVQLSFGFKF